MLLAPIKEAPKLRPVTPPRTARSLRRHFARHNLRVFLLASATLLAVVALWLILFGVCCWLILLALTAIDVPHPHIPRGFAILFAVAALCAVIYAWIDGRLTPNGLPRDDKRPGEIFTDFVLAIPRMTLSIGGTLAAWQRLTDAELVQAAALLHRLSAEPRVRMSSVPLEIPEAAARLKILFALQITKVIDVHRRDNEWWVALNSQRPQNLLLPAARER
jgi:hypothetical protein